MRGIAPLPKRQHNRIGDQRGRRVRNARVPVLLGQRSLEQLLHLLERLLPPIRAPGPGRRDIGGWREAQEGNGLAGRVGRRDMREAFDAFDEAFDAFDEAEERLDARRA